MGDDDMMDPGISRDDSEIGLPKSALRLSHMMLRSRRRRVSWQAQ